MSVKEKAAISNELWQYDGRNQGPIQNETGGGLTKQLEPKCVHVWIGISFTSIPNIIHPPSYPPGLSLLQGSALGLDRVVDDTAGPSREVHGDQGILRYTPLLEETWQGGRVGGVGGGGT